MRVPASMTYRDFQMVFVEKKMSVDEWKVTYKDGIMSLKDDAQVEQAKARNRKIFITNIAIDKVGYVEIPGFSIEESLELQRQHRELLKIAQVSNNSDEVLILRRWATAENLEPLFGSTNEVDINNSIQAQAFFRNSYAREIVLMHNHPSTAGFSFADIGYLISNDYLELMTAVSNQGEVHCLKKMHDFDYNTAQKIYKDIYFKFNPDQQTEMAHDFIKHCREGGIIYVRS